MCVPCLGVMTSTLFFENFSFLVFSEFLGEFFSFWEWIFEDRRVSRKLRRAHLLLLSALCRLLWLSKQFWIFDEVTSVGAAHHRVVLLDFSTHLLLLILLLLNLVSGAKVCICESTWHSYFEVIWGVAVLDRGVTQLWWVCEQGRRVVFFLYWVLVEHLWWCGIFHWGFRFFVEVCELIDEAYSIVLINALFDDVEEDLLVHFLWCGRFESGAHVGL